MNIEEALEAAKQAKPSKRHGNTKDAPPDYYPIWPRLKANGFTRYAASKWIKENTNIGIQMLSINRSLFYWDKKLAKEGRK